MKRAFFIMILSCLAVSTLTAQRPVKHNPKHYKVAEVDATSVSRDGRFLSYTDWTTGDLVVRDLKTGENRRLTNAASGSEEADMSAISHEGKQVAYQCWTKKDGLEDVRVVGLDGLEPRVLYHNVEFPANDPQDWSPDGKHVLTTLFRKNGTNQIVLISAVDGSVRVLKTLDWRHPRRMRFSPDGRYIAYDFPPQEDSPNRGIFVLSADGGRELSLDEHPAHDVLLGWTPEGKQVLFASDRTGNWDVWGVRVVDGKPKGSPKLLKSDVGPIMRGIGVTRDGSCYYGVSTWVNDVYLSKLDLATGKLGVAKKQISHVSFDTSVGWSPDGRLLAYASGWGSEWDPFVLRIRFGETGKEHRVRLDGIHRFGSRPFQPHWSPDGRELLASATDYKGHQGLYRIDAQTGQVSPIVQNKWECEQGCMLWPVWSPDGTVIFARSTGEEANVARSIVRRDPKTGREKELYRAVSPARISHLAVSPDGQRVAFLWYDRGAGKASLKAMLTSGAEAHELVNLSALADYWMPLFALAWTPDSRHLMYAPSTAGQKPKFELWRISAEGGEPQNLGLAMEGVLPYGLSVHPDGRRIAFTAGTPPRSEVWVLKDFLPSKEK